jgi:hypothetical protein
VRVLPCGGRVKFYGVQAYFCFYVRVKIVKKIKLKGTALLLRSKFLRFCGSGARFNVEHVGGCGILALFYIAK